ncbi:Transcriptional regulator, LacI family [plant metagenome]|uniref:Transcriptional regulator, LacI family n=1 Tax=plant metagenome TaxID=1297885 RepID=A0A484PQY7_9ZZZZ
MSKAAPPTSEASDGKARQPRPKGHAVTVRDVARQAGVSVATVSRVLNGNAKVAEALQTLVRDTADQMGYTPNAGARALASQRHTAIGAIVPTLEDANFAVAIDALQRRLTAAGYTLLLASSDYDPAKELKQVRALSAHGLAGLMLVGSRHDPETYKLLAAKRIPYVNTWVVDAKHPSVGFDNRAIGRTVANYLLDLGHRELGVIAQQSLESDRAAERLAGVREALAARGLGLPQEWLIERSHKIADGQVALRRLMAGPRRPTAVLCGTDTLALGALVEARALGLSVPGDLSITGLNDIDVAAHLTPALTTVRLPADEVGARAAEYLLAKCEGQTAPVSSVVPFSLIVRGSTGPAARAAKPGKAAEKSKGKGR